jgi:hypothetical protein
MENATLLAKDNFQHLVLATQLQSSFFFPPFAKGHQTHFIFVLSFEEELLQNICPMLKLCPAVVAILDFQSTANKNRQKGALFVSSEIQDSHHRTYL